MSLALSSRMGNSVNFVRVKEKRRNWAQWRIVSGKEKMLIFTNLQFNRGLSCPLELGGLNGFMCCLRSNGNSCQLRTFQFRDLWLRCLHLSLLVSAFLLLVVGSHPDSLLVSSVMLSEYSVQLLIQNEVI